MPEYAIYLRKSRADKEAEARGEGETLSRHRAMLTELAKRLELNVTGIYKEIISGDSISSRPQVQALLSDVEKGKYAGVLVVEIERLARGDTIDQGIVAKTFRDSSTKIITPSKIYDPDNEFDEEYFEFSLFMSRREYKTINRRMQSGRLAAVKEGNYIGQGTPYGYRKISPAPKIHTLEKVTNEAETVKMIYKMYLDGKGAKAISTELNRLGISPQKSCFWSSSSVKKILSNPIYAGKVRWRSRAGGESLYNGKHEAIIPEEVFFQVQEKKKSRPAIQVKEGYKLRNHYSGIMFCRNCGHQLKRRQCGENEYLLCTYEQCRRKVVSTSVRCADEAVFSAILYRIRKFNSLTACSDTFQGINVNISTEKLIRAEISRLKKQYAKIYELLEQNVYNIDDFKKRRNVLDEKIGMLNSRLSETETENNNECNLNEVITDIGSIAESFCSSDAEMKNNLLKSMIKRISYSKSGDTPLTLEIDFY